MFGKILKKENRFILISWLLFIGIFIFTCFFFGRKITGQLDSDSSSELVLANVLAKNGKFILTPLWNYSTELRVLNIQIVWSLLFRIISNWHLVRVIGTIIWWLIMLFSLYGLCGQLKLKKQYPLIAICFILPISFLSYEYYLTKVGYMTHVMITMNLLTLMFKNINTSNKRTKLITSILGFILAFIAGLAGIRHVMSYVIPLVIGMLFFAIREYKTNNKINIKDYYFTIISVIGIAIGYLINANLLHNIYQFNTYEGNIFISFNLDRLLKSFCSLFVLSGYTGDGTLLSLNTIQNMCSFIILILCISSIVITFKRNNGLSNVEMMMNYFFIFGIITTILILTMTSIAYEARYFLPVYPFSVIVAFIVFSNKNNSFLKNLAIPILVSCYLICGLFAFYSNRDATKTKTKQEVADYLVKNNYLNGYSFFWDANVLTELSNGEIDVWSWGFVSSTPEDFKDIYFTTPWLQKAEHTFKTPTGKVFIMLTHEANDKFKDLTYFFTNEQIVFQNGDYIVYGFNSFEELKKIMHL